METFKSNICVSLYTMQSIENANVNYQFKKGKNIVHLI